MSTLQSVDRVVCLSTLENVSVLDLAMSEVKGLIFVENNDWIIITSLGLTVAVKIRLASRKVSSETKGTLQDCRNRIRNAQLQTNIGIVHITL